ncbi:MAG TPA: MATE family efflux transporter [Bacteroidales bacterium]|nr:MATE family efflux transporter [Bacteroidales bacterium]HNS46715.1 MATE family efflux transporter [Bacteroidales bacterium]
MKDLTSGNESRLIFNFAIPMLMGNVFHQLYNIVDSVIVGRFIGTEALAAVGSSFPIVFTLISLIIGIGTGGTIVIAQYFGARDIQNVKRTIDTLYIFIFFASILITIIGLLASEAIFHLIKLPPEVIPLAKLYLNIFFAGIIFSFGFSATTAILGGLGDSKTPLYFLIISTILNILLDLLLVVGFKWGIAGAAWATVISQATAFFMAVIYLNRRHEIINLSFRKMYFDRGIFRKSLRIGFPVGFQQAFVALSFLAMFWIVNPFGAKVSAAYSIGMRIDSFAAMPAMAFAAALATFAGQNLGASKTERVRTGFYATLRMIFLISVLMTLIAVLFRHGLMTLFTRDEDVIRTGSDYLVIVSSFYVVFSAMIVIGGVMRGSGDTLIPMFTTLFVLWVVRIPASYWLSRHFDVNGIWWGIPIAWCLGLFLQYGYFLTGRWKKKVIVKYQAEP